ncbi:MAG TPA: electron transfer flavoprotein subunit alpha/FixB family protein [Gemmatimonadales bacterium]|nr:electron transfer flavoprotein subunit alpha/FixB family protein [Gemmatimonadales bacterium]
MANVLAVLEQRDGSVRRVSHEALTAGRALADALGGELHAVLVGPSGISADGLGAWGADKVFVAAGDTVAQYQPAPYAAAAVARAQAGDYAAVLLGATALGKDLGPRIAARLAAPILSDVTAIAHDGGIVVHRPVYAGKAIQQLKVTGKTCVITIRPNNFTPAENAHAGAVETVPVPDEAPRARTVAVKESDGAALDVAEAPIVISGGRGLKEPEHFKLIEDLAAAFGNAAVGASRAVVDAGWRPHAEQVGQTGKTVSPNLYFAIGISGAIQHLAGMRTAKVIVAINKDKDAPIFKVADYGIVGDLFEVMPPLIDAVKNARGN